MNNFNFTSQVCTSRSQSELLLALGLKKETADMGWVKMLNGDEYVIAIAEDYAFIDIPAWSLHRLIEIFKKSINISEYLVCSNAYNEIIDDIEYEIKEGHFNKEYLEE